MSQQEDLIRLQKPSGTFTSCEPKNLQIYLNKGFAVVEEAEEVEEVVEETEEATEDGDE